MTDYKQLCAELLRGLDENRHPEVRYPGHLRLVMAAARIALAQPEPADGEVAELVAWLEDEADQYDCIAQAPDTSRKLRRAADLLERLSPPQPEPTDEELKQWYSDCADETIIGNAKHYWAFEVPVDYAIDLTRAVLARWGNHPGSPDSSTQPC